jgi:hypothetical protein
MRPQRHAEHTLTLVVTFVNGFSTGPAAERGEIVAGRGGKEIQAKAETASQPLQAALRARAPSC